MIDNGCRMLHRLTRRRLLAGISAGLLPLLTHGEGAARAQGATTEPAARSIVATHVTTSLGANSVLFPVPTLLVYNTVQGLLSGDLEHAISPSLVQADIDGFPADWLTLGVGTTNRRGRTGELIPDGTARDVRFWWADPSSPTQADVSDLAAIPGLNSVELPFLALGIGDPATVIQWSLDDLPAVHSWLREQLTGAGIELAAIRLEGTFGDVMTTVSYNIPPTGIPSGSVYSGDSFFRFGDYPSGNWNMDGVYADPAALQPVISTPGNPLHLHGYQPELELGGHIVSAAAVEVSAWVYPLAQVVVRPTGLSP